jgi:O-antigen/teichoic acid export membrane protein
VSYLKKLAGQTAIYGLSSMAGRFINYLLVFVHTRAFLPEEFGVITGMYSYVSFLLIVFTYGMETAFFRFSTGTQHPRQQVLGTSMVSLLISSVLLFFLIVPFRGSIATFIEYPSHPEYIVWFALILSIDAVTAIPFVNLRLENRPLQFALLKLAGILINVILNLFFLLLCPYLLEQDVEWVKAFYDPGFGVGYVFLSNLVASVCTLLLLLPGMFRAKMSVNTALLRRMLGYALPLLPAGLAGMVNETLDRILLLKLIPERSEALFQTGIYGANYKLAMLMTLFIQMYRYAAEPFFFSEADKEGAKDRYAAIMKYFTAACLFIFLVVMLYIDLIKGFIGENYHSGLSVVPVLLLANVCLGIYINLSIWFKLTDQTRFGLYFTLVGALLTVVLNYLLIPRYGYTGSAWATLICYAAMAGTCYVVGQKHYPVIYPLGRMALYGVLALVIYAGSAALRNLNAGTAVTLSLNTLGLLLYAGVFYSLEKVKKIVP